MTTLRSTAVIQVAPAITPSRSKDRTEAADLALQNIVKSAAVKALRDALENEVAALVLKLLVEYQVADIAGDPIKID